MWVNFTNATKWQAEGIFKCFFPSRAAKEKLAAEAAADLASDPSMMPTMRRKTSKTAVPLLEQEEIDELAKRFAEQIPEDEMSVSFSLTSRRCGLTRFRIGGESAGLLA